MARLLALAAVAGVVRAQVNTAVATFSADTGDVMGLITFTNVGSGGVSVSVDLCYADGTRAPTSGHNWHVHMDGGEAPAPHPLTVGGDGHYDCASAGAHFDPYSKEVDLYRCDPAAPDNCYMGDMSGKLGTANIGSPTVLTTRVDLSAQASAAQFQSHSVVIHAADRGAARIACAPVTQTREVPTNPCAPTTPVRPPPPPVSQCSELQTAAMVRCTDDCASCQVDLTRIVLGDCMLADGSLASDSLCAAPPRPPPPPPAGTGGPTPAPPRPPPPPPTGTSGTAGTDNKCELGSGGYRCDVDCDTCIETQAVFTTANPNPTKQAETFSGMAQCTIDAGTPLESVVHVADQQKCLTEMADNGMLQPLLKTLSCCVRDANRAGACEIVDGKGCILSTGPQGKFPGLADDRSNSPNTCEIMYTLDKIHTCGQSKSLLDDPAALEDANGVRCIAEMQWTDGAKQRSMQLGLPCDKLKDKLCFQGSSCSYPVMTCLLKTGVLGNITRDCYTSSFPADTPVNPSFPDEKIICDKLSQFSGASVPYFCLAISAILMLLSYLLIKVWFIVHVAKLLLYIYVVVEAVCGFCVGIWSLWLLADEDTPVQFSLGCLGTASLMLFVAGTFYKGLKDTPCMLNISFLAGLVMAVVFLIAGIALLFGSDEVCAKAEELLKKNGAPEQKISDVENHLQSSSTMLQNILLLVGGVAASSVILSLRMKDKLREAKEQAEEKLVASDAKELDKKEQEREKWKQKMAQQVAKEEKKKSKR